MRDSLVFHGSALWNEAVNCNDKIDNLIFKEINSLLRIVFTATSCVD